MNPKVIFYLLLLSLLVYEGWTLSNAASGDTISEIVWGWLASDYGVLIAYALGFLHGHFFWQRKQ